MKLLKLVGSQVKVGVNLPWSIRNERGMLLLARGHIIRDEEEMRHLLQRGAYIDDEEPSPILIGSSSKSGSAPLRARGLCSEWAAVYQRLEGPLKDIGNESGFAELIDALAREIVALVERDPDLTIYMIVRQEDLQFFNYGFAHSVHTAATCVLVARRLGWPAEQALVLAKAALTMNVAIVELQGRIATQDTALVDSQRNAIREHTVNSVAMLKEAGVADADWLTAVAQHHERPDGTGYPGGLTDISPMGLTLRHADTYTAKISPRASRPGITPRQAARELFQEDKGGPLSTALIKELGIHPPGEFVKLNSGELAVVMRRSAAAGKPLAASVTDRTGNPVPNTIQRDTANPEFAIISSVTDARQVAMLARVPPQRLYGLSV